MRETLVSAPPSLATLKKALARALATAARRVTSRGGLQHERPRGARPLESALARLGEPGLLGLELLGGRSEEAQRSGSPFWTGAARGWPST